MLQFTMTNSIFAQVESKDPPKMMQSIGVSFSMKQIE